MVFRSETTALSRGWKDRPKAVRVSVGKLHVTFFLWCCSETEGWGDCLLWFLDHTQIDTDTLGSPEIITSSPQRTLTTQHTTNTKKLISMPLSKFEATHNSETLVNTSGLSRLLLYSTLHHLAGCKSCGVYTLWRVATTHHG